MRYFPFVLSLSLFLFCSCAESLEDQTIAVLEQDRIFEIDLEERRYGFGYISSTEDDPDRANPNRFRELIVLTTDNVRSGEGLLSGTSQVIGIELEYSRVPGPEALSIDLSRLNQGGTVTFTRVFLGEDFNFVTAGARRKVSLNVGELSLIRYSNGARTITLDTRSGGIPVLGSWTGKLEEAGVFF